MNIDPFGQGFDHALDRKKKSNGKERNTKEKNGKEKNGKENSIASVRLCFQVSDVV